MWRETRRRGKERTLGERTEEDASTEAKSKETIDEEHWAHKGKIHVKKGERRIKGKK